MSKKDDLIETISKNKQVNVLLWFVVALVIGGVCYVLFELKSCGNGIGEIVDSREVSMGHSAKQLSKNTLLSRI